jgi:hypothetical protein
MGGGRGLKLAVKMPYPLSSNFADVSFPPKSLRREFQGESGSVVFNVTVELFTF